MKFLDLLNNTTADSNFINLQVQFVLVMVHAFQLLFIDCNYPKAFVWWIGLHAVMFYFLFADFYKQAYKKGAYKVCFVNFYKNFTILGQTFTNHIYRAENLQISSQKVWFKIILTLK